MRPRFDLTIQTSETQALLLELTARLRRPGSPVQGRVLSNHVELTTCAEQCHVWSPRLTLHVESSEDGSDILSGRFSPHPNVWTGFMTLYSTITLAGVFAAVFGFSQWTLGMTPWAFLGVPLALALFAFSYGAAFIGQGLGAEEMYVLRSELDEALRAVRARGELQAGGL